ncbi:response regulator [Sphingobacterium sp. N143]|uniref:response regulator transcription factor n=1 Tax=Sphingobacterium sp. N143 TaxID=2746727 RepID=UPI002576E4BC|nr:response regulator [Sphingobacterium sp. N143]MDM1293358.1 response regulator [Sphingobacterium sp. N143]
MSRQKIFICDDGPIGEMLCFALSQSTDNEVFSETKSAKAFDFIEKERPTILIVDLNMPEVSGASLITKIRKSENLSSLGIICISAEFNGKEIAMAAGADIFVAKPFNLDEILDAIYRLSA